MSRKLCTWLAVALAGGALGAGCGSSSSSTTSSQSSSTPAASTPATAATTTTQASSPGATGTTSTPSGASALAVQQIVGECQAVIHQAPTLSASVKARVEGVCNKAASGDLAGARAAAKEVCVEVINASPVPAVAKQAALAACRAK
jgi:hypothetical protein